VLFELLESLGFGLERREAGLERDAQHEEFLASK
jgi:hypothetical protein